MPTVAFVTYRDLPGLAADDRLAVAALAARGVATEGAAWDDPDVDWRAFDAVVVRSTWDYHLRAPEFAAWFARLERDAVPLWNPARLLRWNMDKRYLRALGERGVPTVPTRWIERGASARLRDVLDERGWDDAVVKPAVSASGHGTWRVGRGAADERQRDLDALLARSAVMVQPFVEEVVRDGEWSLVFLGGAFSHAVRKRARAGEFRVQHDFGGSARAERAPSWLVEQGARALRAAEADAGAPWLYARVDGIVTRDAGGDRRRFLLTELEMLEPSLFLALDAAAPARFAAAIAGRASGVVGSPADASTPEPRLPTPAA